MKKKKTGSKAKKVKKTAPGTIRIKAKTLESYVKTDKSWKKSDKTFPELMLVVNLYKKGGKLSMLIDKKNPEFLKGQLSPEGVAQGARINALPNEKVLSKAFSLFAPHLMIHDESTKSHWDVIYQNPCGTYSYLYTLDKVQKSRKKKYEAVKEFEKCYPELKAKAFAALKDNDDPHAVAMCTLLKTYMRIGNEIYYKLNRHKGLSTMKKSDITIKGRNVSFNFIGKGGVPTSITETFPQVYIDRLKDMLNRTENDSFVFIDKKTGHPIKEEHFKSAFKKYCGKEFYPHIVRSFYATNKVKEFLASRKSINKKEAHSLFYSIAEKLGHKRFSKKENTWRENYTVTINHYVEPELLEQVKSAILKSA